MSASGQAGVANNSLTITLSAAATIVPVGTTFRSNTVITATVTKSDNTALAGAIVEFSTNLVSMQSQHSTTNAAGQAVVTFQGGTSPGIATIQASLPAGTTGPASVQVCVIQVNMSVNNTPATSQSYVHPANAYSDVWTSLTYNISVVGANQTVGVALVNPANTDGTLGFSVSSLPLNPNGQPSNFAITGTSLSSHVNGAIIEVHLGSSTGALLTTTSATVMWYTQVHISAKMNTRFVLKMNTHFARR